MLGQKEGRTGKEIKEAVTRKLSKVSIQIGSYILSSNFGFYFSFELWSLKTRLCWTELENQKNYTI